MSHLDFEEMARDHRSDREDFAIAHHGEFLNLLMMILDESQMSEKSRLVFPAREGCRVDQETVEFAVRLDVGIDLTADLFEVSGFQWSGGFEDQNPLFLVEFMLDLWSPRLLRMGRIEAEVLGGSMVAGSMRMGRRRGEVRNMSRRILA